jgi:hypothetical protein
LARPIELNYRAAQYKTQEPVILQIRSLGPRGTGTGLKPGSDAGGNLNRKQQIKELPVTSSHYHYSRKYRYRVPEAQTPVRVPVHYPVRENILFLFSCQVCRDS